MPISLRLGDELEQRLSVLSQMTGRPKVYYIRKALERELEDMEDIYMSEIAYETTSRLWSLEEVEKDLGLAD